MPRKHRANENRQGSRKPCRENEENSKPRPRRVSNTKRPRGSATQLAATMTMNICSANNKYVFTKIPNMSTRASLGSSSECPSPWESTYIIQQGKSNIADASISSGFSQRQKDPWEEGLNERKAFGFCEPISSFESEQLRRTIYLVKWERSRHHILLGFDKTFNKALQKGSFLLLAIHFSFQDAG